jgi:hypothetical protein
LGILVDLVAGDAREILLAVGIEDWAGLRDPRRFVAHLSLGGVGHSWLDLFAQAAREVGGDSTPEAFGDSVYALDSRLTSISERTVERVAPAWVDGVARLADRRLDAIAARWIELIERAGCAVESDEKPSLRHLAGELVAFCRRAEDAEDVLFVWSI